MEPKDNRGVLFPNPEKTEPHHYDWEGSIIIEGKRYWINAFERNSEKHERYLSVRVKPKPESSNGKA